MTFRPGPLRAAAALAAGFIAVRVVYRVLFHGADGAGAVLLDLPALRLPPPLGHVELLGPVTSGGLWTAVASALPIAAVILAFGLLNAFLDVPRLLARGARTGPLRGLARALSVAWATLPALVDAVRAVRFAQRLRGERAGVRTLAPVLERTIERATAVAAALELRGYAGRFLEGDCAHPVELRDARAGFDDRATGGTGLRTIVRVDALSLPHGEVVVLAGATGSGKSTLLRALSGLHSHVDGGVLTGDVRVVGHDRRAIPPRDTARTVGVVLQHPREAFVTDRVDEEIGLSLELRGVAPVLRGARVHEVAARVGISDLLGRRLRGLSAGEATLVAIAAAIVEQPVLLLVDEPLADLDTSARARIVTLLGALAHEAGICVVVAEHRTGALAGVADRVLRIEGGEVVGGAVVEPDAAEEGRGTAGAGSSAPWMSRRDAFTTPDDRGANGGHDPAHPVQAASVRSCEHPAVMLSAAEVTIRRGDRVAVDAATVTLRAGERVALVGANGAGKSTLLTALATGTGGAPSPGRRVALVPDASDDLFVRDTVGAECRRADRRAGVAAGTTLSRFTTLRGRDVDDAERLGARHPRDLSAGERRCLAIALQTAHRPAVLLVDEPTRGLDPAARDLVRRALCAEADAGTAVLFATHDAGFAAGLADRVVTMAAGVLTPADGALRPDADVTPADAVRVRRAPTAPTAAAPAAAPATADVAVARRGRVWAWPGGRAWPSGRAAALLGAQLTALTAFLWPLVASAVPAQAQAAVPYIALSLAPLAIVLVLAALDASVRSAHTLALLAVLAAVGAAVRIASTGVGGVEALFVLLILAGRAFGPRFGLLLGAAAIALSAVMWGGIGPWLPFQMFACGWVGAGAGLLPRRVRGGREILMLCAYGIASSYLFGLIMNMWFWPFAVGAGTSISYTPGAPLTENLGAFLVYSLVTSTATWDTLRAVTTVVGLLLVGRPVLASLRRAKPVAAPGAPASASRSASRATDRQHAAQAFTRR